MQLGTFLFGTFIASVAATGTAITAGLSVLPALGFGALTAFVAQMLYLALITTLVMRDTDDWRAPNGVRSAKAKADRKPVGTAQP